MSTNVENSTASSKMHYEGLVWCGVFGLESTLIILGNVLTIGAFAKQKYLRKRGTYLLINLAVSDVFVGVFPLPFYIYFIGVQFQLWPAYYIDVLSLVFYFLDILFGIASLANLTIIALERVYAAKRPFKYRTAAPRSYYTAIGITWTIAIGSASFCFCAFYISSSLFISTYTSMTIVFIAFCLITSSYSIVWIRLRLHSTKKSRKTSENERKLGITMIILTVLSLSAWLPFVMMNLIIVLSKSKAPNYNIIFTTKLLHYANSLTNCIIYSLRMPGFRKAVLTILKLDRSDNSGLNSPMESSGFSPLRTRRMRNSRTLNGSSTKHAHNVKIEML